MQIPFFEEKANIPKYFLDIRSCRCSLWDINVFHYLGNIRRIFATILLTSAYITTRVCSKCASNLQFMHTKTHLIVNNLMLETDFAFHTKDSLHINITKLDSEIISYDSLTRSNIMVICKLLQEWLILMKLSKRNCRWPTFYNF